MICKAAAAKIMFNPLCNITRWGVGQEGVCPIPRTQKIPVPAVTCLYQFLLCGLEAP